MRPAPFAQVANGASRGFANGERVAPINALQDAGVERADVPRRHFGSGRRNAVTVVSHHKKRGQILLQGETKRLIKLALTGRSVADKANRDSAFAFFLRAPRRSNGGQTLNARWRGRRKDAAFVASEVAAHQAARAQSIAFAKKVERDFKVRHAARQSDGAFAVIRENPIARAQVGTHGGEGFVSGAGNLQKAAPLTNQNAFAPVAFARGRHQAQKFKLVFDDEEILAVQADLP